MRGRYVALAISGVVLLGVGVAGGIAWSERRAARAARTLEAKAESPGTGRAAAPPSSEPAEVTLTAEAIQRAGIKTAVVGAGALRAALSVPATITSNAYRDTKVHALVGGIVRQVDVELGTGVRRGQRLAVLVSSDLADAQMKYVSGRAMLEADHQKLERTRILFARDLVSRQELEGIAATHDARETEVAAARQRLLLLGLSDAQVENLRAASQVVSEVTVSAPADGVVIGRAVNPGQAVAAAQELFTVTDLGTVWAIGDLYEKDFGAVQIGTEAALTVPGIGPPLQGRVSYIDARVDQAARTAKVRVEVPNRAGVLRLGMFVTLTFQTTAADRPVVVPRNAVQMLGERAVVYLDTGEGRFVERTLKLGPVTGTSVEVLDGLKPGERVVVEGSFFVRAEAARTRSSE